jgi:anaerobic sulfatase-maturating enzyme
MAEPTIACLVMAKPGGSRCNLRCDYCYYLGTEGADSRSPWPMPDGLLESYIAQRIESSPPGAVHFEWHGGEPTMLGLEYFRRITRFQAAHAVAGRRITNGLQTNGLLIDAQWADFLAAELFSVGLSLDGPEELHDAHRRGPAGEGSHAAAMRAYDLLRERGVFTSILCVLHRENAACPERVYGFFRDIGAKYLQFLPLTPRPGLPGARTASADPETLGDFLCAVFDMWIGRDVGRLVVQQFDEALRPLYGVPHALCVHRPSCGDAAALERDGSFYPCDHFVDAAHRVGALGERSFVELASDPGMAAFGEAKRELPRACRDCELLAFCNGGCPKDRFALSPDGEAGLNYLCAAYKRFFFHSRPELARLAAHMRANRRLRDFRPAG